MFKDIVVLPLLTGLSTGIYCLSCCFPFLAPLLVSEARSKRGNLGVVLKFIFGRFLGSLMFGAVIGFLGEKINNILFQNILNISLIILSVFLILHALGLLSQRKNRFCQIMKKFNPRLPFLMGIFLGINVCPPFLISLTYVFSLQSVFKGMFYFLMFFVGSSFYFLPLFFLGFLNKMKEFRLIGRVTALIVGIIFFFYGLYGILEAEVASRWFLGYGF